MVMNFWESQAKRRSLTAFYLVIFITLTLATAAGAEIALRYFTPEDYHPGLPILGLGFLAVTFAVAAFNYLQYKLTGGAYVAESLGGYRVDPETRDPDEKRLLNIVEEMSVAAGLPMPQVYILPANEINAFAAGLKKDNATMAITEGALTKLSRDEIQGVIAHELGHVYNGDMVISLRLAAMVMGFFFVLYLGLRILQGTGFSRRREEGEGKGGNPILLAAIILMIAGALTWFLGSILKAMVSRQREYLADASAVQFTRNPSGIANALRKIANDDKHDMPKTGGGYAHMYLDDRVSLFATHPPLWKRIAILEGRENIPEEER